MNAIIIIEPSRIMRGCLRDNIERDRSCTFTYYAAYGTRARKRFHGVRKRVENRTRGRFALRFGLLLRTIKSSYLRCKHNEEMLILG